MSERRFVLHNDFIRTNLVSFLQKMSLDTTMEVIVRPFIEKRSLEQNARLWLLHTKAADFVGVTAEDMHEEMLCKVYGYSEVRMPSGYMKRVPLKRSSARNRKEFAQFMEQVEAFYISELGVWLDQREIA
jgi:NinB protein